MQLTSTAFDHLGDIPARHTCEGENLSPPLAWSGAPAGTRSFALIVDDPDAPDPAAPRKVWVHWIVYNLPAATHALPEGGALPAGALSGRNDSHVTEWDGPCPPIGRHRYFIQAFRARHRAAGLEGAIEGCVRHGDGGARDRAHGADGHLSEVPALTARYLR